MATALAAKRMARERKALETPNDDYFVHFQDDNLFEFDAYIIGPAETLYSHKFAKIHFVIPQDYPLRPPKCKFIQHSGGRIHPNLYVEGKVCLSILGTWAGEPWATAMTCETVLITIRSILDNQPYTHEPGQRDDPAFNNYVQYSTWRWLLIDHLRREQDPHLKISLQSHIAKHSKAILAEFKQQRIANAGVRSFPSKYDRQTLVVNYATLEKELKKCIEDCQAAVALSDAAVVANVTEIPDVVEVASSSTVQTDNSSKRAI